MATWPTLDEVKAELRVVDTNDDLVIESGLAAAVDYVTGRLDPTYIDGDEIPDAVHHATLLLAARYHRRRDSVDGTIGWGDMGVVRVGPKDPDVEALLAQYLAIVFG